MDRDCSIVARRGDVHVFLKKDGGVIHGKVGGQNGSRPHSAFVALAPKNEALRHHLRTVTPAGDGSFQIRGIAPGSYYLVALDGSPDPAGLELEALAPYRDKAASVEVRPAGEYSVDLTAVPGR